LVIGQVTRITEVETTRSQAFLCLSNNHLTGEKVKALITEKLGMTSTIDKDGVVSAVTLLSVSPNIVTQLKDIEKDGYVALQVGAGETKKLSKPMAGHVKQAKATPSIIREFRIDELPEETNVGTEIKADVFSVGDIVQVTGTSKGKGWAGTIKRHNFHRQRKTHGGKGDTRKVGSIGSMYPQKIFKGKKMAGRMGNAQVTVKNLKVALVDMENNVIGVVGAVPGPRKSIVIVRSKA
jgi:large subunit ribosomal protein L3